LILVDGVPFPDANSLFSIDPSMVDRIEVVTSASPQFGSRGTNGVISIFMKTGYSAQGEVQKNYISYKIPGYSRSKAFVSPDYSASKESQNPDFRTTIFWKPNLLTDETGKTSVQFYAADLVTRYRIVVEGVTESGRPVRAVKYVTVE
jgi:outer membrane receptor protein involved in Fe transport